MIAAAPKADQRAGGLSAMIPAKCGAMKYPSLVDIEEMRSRGDDTSVIEQQRGLYRRGRIEPRVALPPIFCKPGTGRRP